MKRNAVLQEECRGQDEENEGDAQNEPGNELWRSEKGVEYEAGSLKRAQHRERKSRNLYAGPNDIRDEEEEHANLPSSTAVRWSTRNMVFFAVF
ncbi:hypothetical protein LTR28_005018 [Elasticomyces elasticus]|nr:hypothetical protein LTR28_005018 [Elasticomyces elasticus]